MIGREATSQASATREAPVRTEPHPTGSFTLPAPGFPRRPVIYLSAQARGFLTVGSLQLSKTRAASLSLHCAGQQSGDEIALYEEVKKDERERDNDENREKRSGVSHVN